MKEVKIIIISSLILFLGCKNKISDLDSREKNSVDSVNLESNKVESEIKNYTKKQSGKDCNETFDSFFERFSKDSIFQKSRIKYPLKWYYLEDNESNKLSFDVINEIDDYDYIDFTSDNKSDKYDVVHEKKEKERSYILKGNDSGLFMTYKFRIIDGCWYMIEILDEST